MPRWLGFDCSYVIQLFWLRNVVLVKIKTYPAWYSTSYRS